MEDTQESSSSKRPPYYQQEFTLEYLNRVIDEKNIDKRVKDIVLKTNLLPNKVKISTLLKSITFIDLTSLGGNDTKKTIEALCLKAANPIEPKFILKESLTTAAVCVYPARLLDAVDSLKKCDPGSKIRIASVAAGFPSGQYPLKTRLGEIHAAIEDGANEIDVVINRTLVIDKEWEALYDELCSMRKACNMYKKKVCLKTILATGELPTLQDVYNASMVAMMAGSDFIKTSTGKETVNATLPVGIVMCKAIMDYYNWTDRKVGFKPAGGIKTADQVLEWVVLMAEELGSEWQNQDLLRIGASSVLDDILKRVNSLYDECISEN
ncbi:deoxyribose-phosphate aldolase [Prorops nasuta]|uniref:deoxyribose-phosphate aldolase n=1 Tax=Prorops nasuta TaxID=863751 RepID=UPI0034CD751C